MSLLGIDFGTSKCRVLAAARSGTLRVSDTDGGTSIPTMVACSSSGRVVVGADVWRATETPAMQLITGIVRLLGRRYYSREIEWLRHSCSHDIVPAPNGDAWLRVGTLEYSPEEIVAELLRHICARAAQLTGEAVDQAVIAVPTIFDQLQRRAMLAAAEQAGLRVAMLINATSAAAIALADHARGERVALLDLGGGYFDCALLERRPGGLQVIANSGDGMLGGMDFDRRMVDLIAIDADIEIERVCLRGERLRHALSFQDSVALHSILQDPTDERVITRAEHDERVHDELAALAVPCGWVFEDVQLGTDDIDEVILLGGMAHVPAVRAELSELFRRTPRTPEQHDVLVASGALACVLQQGHGVAQLSSKNIGVKVRGGVMSPVLPRARPVPYAGEVAFAPPREGQQRIVFEIYEGDAEYATDNLYLGTFVLEGLRAGVAPRVTFCLDPSGVISVPGWHGAGAGGRVDFRWAGGAKVLPVRQPVAPDDSREQMAAIGYARVGSDSAEEPTQQLDRAALAALRDSERPAQSAPPASGESRRPPARKVESRAAPPSSEQAPPSGDALVGTVVGGRYLIEDLVAEGGMGRVYRAVHETLGRKFAVKVLHPELSSNEELAARFLREAQSAARIESEHVVDIVDFGRLGDGTGYFVMEYLEGQTLRQLLDERGALPVELARDIGMQLAYGVSAAHDLDIIHRDLKPDNVVLVKRSKRPYFCKILDFGIAKHPTSDRGDGPITLQGTMVGSPYYMSPEQIIGGPVTARTDIYALGVVLYEMLAGHPPFNADSVAHLLQQHVDAPPPPLAGLSVKVPESLERVIHLCMAKKPDERVASAAALQRLLAEAL